MNYEFYVNINISEMSYRSQKLRCFNWPKKLVEKKARFFEKKFEERSGQGKQWLLKVSARTIFK